VSAIEQERVASEVEEKKEKEKTKNVETEKKEMNFSLMTGVIIQKEFLNLKVLLEY